MRYTSAHAVNSSSNGGAVCTLQHAAKLKSCSVVLTVLLLLSIIITACSGHTITLLLLPLIVTCTQGYTNEASHFAAAITVE
jgi:hypothetical protein